jgi:hypothetical protein
MGEPMTSRLARFADVFGIAQMELPIPTRFHFPDQHKIPKAR